MPLKPFQFKTQHYSTNSHAKVSPKSPVKNDGDNSYPHDVNDIDAHNLRTTNTTRYNHGCLDNSLIKIQGNVTGINDDSEWILFSPFDENARSYEYGHAHETINSATIADDHSTSVLSTRYSSYSSPSTNELNKGYVISDFDQSCISGIEGENDGNDDNSDGAVNDDEFIDSDDDGSLIDEVRDGMNTLRKNKLDELTVKNQKELINRINDWKFNVITINSNSTSAIHYKDTEGSIKMKSTNSKSKLKSKLLSNSQSQSEKEKEREIKELKKVVGRLYTALKIDYDSKSLVDHEGVFMNNPDLESCVPGYWKRIMLDNLMQINASDHNSILGINKDDINASKLNNKNFWEIDESGSVQSVSTGWDANHLHGFH